MHTGQAMPILDENTNMHAVLLEMTSKCLGCVGFVNQKGEFTGMLTDGDLRRCLSSSILNAIGLEMKSLKNFISAKKQSNPQKSLWEFRVLRLHKRDNR